MNLIVHRRFLGEEYTIGSLYIDGEYFCDTLEDKDRGLTQDMPMEEIQSIKVMHETAIPTGEYKVIVNISPAKKRMLPRLLDVPGFSGILIHRGNTKHDSSGCILVGENKVKGKVINSTQYEKRLVKILTDAQEQGEEIRISITYLHNEQNFQNLQNDEQNNSVNYANYDNSVNDWCRVTFRAYYTPDHSVAHLGFRLVLP